MISLIIPAFNEEEALRAVLPRLPAVIDGHRVRTLLVSDGSTDNTVAVAIEHGVAVLALMSNQGKGSAVRAALDALGDAGHVVVMDADGQHRPEDIPRLIRPILNGEADVVLASRYSQDEGRSNTPLNRYLVRTLTVAVLNRMLGRRFTDPYCGFRAFSGAVLGDVSICGERYEGELESIFDSCRCGLTTIEVPIDRIYGPATSKMAMDGGRLLGRVRAIRQYAATIVRKRREMRSVSASRQVREREVA